MNIWGKVLGSAAGLALGGPLGALVGLAAGHAVDRFNQPADVAVLSPEDPLDSVAFTIATIALGAKMAKADGHVSKAEIAAFREVFRVPEEDEGSVARFFNLARRDVAGYETYARQIGQMFADRHAVLEELVQCLFHIAKADGGIKEAELNYLKRVAHLFGLTENCFERIRAAEVGPDATDPYAVLGVSRDADEETIRDTWRRLVRENHPDRLVAEGMPEELVALANDKLAAINAAYDRVRRQGV